MRIAIIGSGISGLSLANMLKCNFEIDIFEKAERPGGLIKCDYVENNLFHKVGGHVFNSKNQAVLDWFWGFFDREKEFIMAKRNAQILLGDAIIGYPIENYIYTLDRNTVTKIIKEILSLYTNGYKDPYLYDNFEDFLKGNFGDTLYKLYFKPYNEKIWKRELSSIPLRWLEGKLPMPSYEDIIIKNILRSEEKDMVHSSFYYAKNSGSQFIVDRLAKGLKILTDFDVTSIKRSKEGWQINGKGNYDHVVYTGDIRDLSSILSLEYSPLDKFRKDLSQLQSNGTSNVLCKCEPNDLSWLYLPNSNVLAHRIIYTGNFSPNNNSNSQINSCVVEFSGLVDEETMFKQIKNLPGKLIPIGVNYEPKSYIIHNSETLKLIFDIKNALKPLNISLLGRFAEWSYFNMDTAIESSMIISKQLKEDYV